MHILWALSSVGKGHMMRDLAIVNKLQARADVHIDWLAPEPVGALLQERGYHVLPCSADLTGSGVAYNRVFADSIDVFNLMDYVRADRQCQRLDFEVSRQAWENTTYDLVVGDEAFWLLAGFWKDSPAPFVFLTDFIGVKPMRPRLRDWITAWTNNYQFMFVPDCADELVYFGYEGEIPAGRLGLMLPDRQAWAAQHFRCVKPVLGFDPTDLPDRAVLRQQQGIPPDTTFFVATVGSLGDKIKLVQVIQRVFRDLQKDYPQAEFLIVGIDHCDTPGIRCVQYVEKLYLTFAAADFVITEAGYGKTTELSAMGIPFIAIPLDYHFEQEYVVGHRLAYHDTGRLITLRDHTPESIASYVREGLNKPSTRIQTDQGDEVATLLLNYA